MSCPEALDSYTHEDLQGHGPIPRTGSNRNLPDMGGDDHDMLGLTRRGLKVPRGRGRRRGGTGLSEEDLARLDPAKRKRILANRQSAAKSKSKRDRTRMENEQQVESMFKDARMLAHLVEQMRLDNATLAEATAGYSQQIRALEAQLEECQGLSRDMQQQLQQLQQQHGQLPRGLPAVQQRAMEPPHLPVLRLNGSAAALTPEEETALKEEVQPVLKTTMENMDLLELVKAAFPLAKVIRRVQQQQQQGASTPPPPPVPAPAAATVPTGREEEHDVHLQGTPADDSPGRTASLSSSAPMLPSPGPDARSLSPLPAFAAGAGAGDAARLPRRMWSPLASSADGSGSGFPGSCLLPSSDASGPLRDSLNLDELAMPDDLFSEPQSAHEAPSIAAGAAECGREASVPPGSEACSGRAGGEMLATGSVAMAGGQLSPIKEELLPMPMAAAIRPPPLHMSACLSADGRALLQGGLAATQP